jgi:predicted RNA-binding protein with PIN domain
VREILLEATQALGIVAGVVAAGLGSAQLGTAGAPYPRDEVESEVHEMERSPGDPGAQEPSEPIRPPRLWLVDGFNVLHAGVLAGRDRASWWSESRRAELLAIVERFDAERDDAEVWVVFDGSGAAQEPVEGRRVHVAFARSADDWLVKRARDAGEPVCVVTSDRELADRARRRGAEVLSPRRFLARCARS